MDINPLERDVAWFLNILLMDIDGDFLPDNYKLLKRRFVKSKRNKHLTGAVFCKEYSSFFATFKCDPA
jgi:hypothetical protein